MNKIKIILFIQILIPLITCNSIHNIEVLDTKTINFNNIEDSNSRETLENIITEKAIIVGANQLEKYIDLLKDKKIAIVANHTSFINNTHIVDSLLSLNINVVKIFAPEHGFRGTTSAGTKINNSIDSITNLPLISLYGKNKKPTKEQMADIDLIIFDIQDVGVRFYTYISTMHYVMEACAENKKKIIVLDRPNPNGFYVDGPILQNEFKSFVGMHPIPIVYGLTIAELATMINGEKWLKNKQICDLTVIKCENYTHRTYYKLPIKPSPNLPNMNSIYLYPSLCLFEATDISVGRGTNMQFQVIGNPNLKKYDFEFTPKSVEGSVNPPFENKKCYGYDLRKSNYIDEIKQNGLNFQFLINIYKQNNKFITNNLFFDKLAGNSTIREMILNNKSQAEIKESYQKELEEYKLLRNKYLLYKDFE